MEKTCSMKYSTLHSIEVSDEELVARAQDDPQAFADLYDRYLPLVYRYLYARIGEPEEVEDLTSQVFLDALRAFPRYRHQGHFAAWLLVIARRKAADHYRKRIPQVSIDMAGGMHSTEPNPLAQVVQADELCRLSELVNELAEEERELLRLRFAARLSFGEIAGLLKRKESAVKMALYRLLERLQAQLEAKDAR